MAKNGDGWTIATGRRSKAGGNQKSQHKHTGVQHKEASQADSLSRSEDSPQETGSKQADEGKFVLRQGRRQNRRLRGPRTTEEQVARLAVMVAECRQEVVGSRFFQHLLQVMTQAAEHLPAHATASVDTTGPSHNPHNGSSSGQALSSAPGAWTPDCIANLAGASPTAQPTAEQTQYATAELNHQTLGCTVAAGLASPGPLLDAPMLADRFTECSPQATSSSRGAAEDARRTAAADSNALHHVPCTPSAGPQKEAVAMGESEVLVGMAHALVSSWPSPVANAMHGSTHSDSDMSLAGWGSVKHLVVYGLGSLDSRTSRYQLALALLLRDHLPCLAGPPEAFDPAFTEVDAALLSQLGVTPMSVNEGGARSVSEPTLFYLPHCEGSLCDALLGANWNPYQLPHVCILGNRFSTYAERWAVAGASPASRLSRPDKLLALHDTGAVEEAATPDFRFSAPSAFNDMSLHVFPQARVVISGLFSSTEGS